MAENRKSRNLVVEDEKAISRLISDLPEFKALMKEWEEKLAKEKAGEKQKEK